MFEIFKKEKQEEFYAPCSGKIISITEVNDPVFSQKLLGEGFAIIPDNTKIYAPLAGRVTNIFPTKHAINIKSNSGIDYLIHIGIDTVELQGEPFSICVKENDVVTSETLLVDVDFEKIIKSGRDTSVIVVFPEKNQFSDLIIDNGRIDNGNLCGKITRI
ncbi:PTS sugar transporter subunit IIA [Enterococcus hirae]|uniref:PTS sugar transporter subunit IIA n=1 Tax=Enterococcus hirae TaxID=1354 RepID=UPI001A968E84|nr:PTS glucose transporter subunit IIA [Enterococcus hirae]MBO1117033.1 PTS glucose transporter subunit IIA [Enterococcus hirae]MBO1135001.1 PTS glucose transporter subunit IIA [Enterococcus hirae]